MVTRRNLAQGGGKVKYFLEILYKLTLNERLRGSIPD